MNRTLPYGGSHKNSRSSRDLQVARASQDVRSSQAAHSNLAVQPATKKGTLKLKKNAVKIVGAARCAPPPEPVTNSSRASISSSPSLSSPAPGPTSTQSKPAGGGNPSATLELTRKSSSLDLVPTPPHPKVELPSQSLFGENFLDDMFMRLSTAASTISSKLVEEPLPDRPTNSSFSLDDHPESSNLADKSSGDAESSGKMIQSGLESLPAASEDIELQSRGPQSMIKSQRTSPSATWQDLSRDKLEQEYLRKAAAYVNALPSTPGSSAFMIKTASAKLRVSYSPKFTNLRLKKATELQARYNLAVTDYVNARVNISTEPLTSEFVGKMLHESNGDFLALYAALVDGKYIALGSLEQVTGLCQNILDVLPELEHASNSRPKHIEADAVKTNPAAPITAPVSDPKVPFTDMSNDMEVWPIRQKRGSSAIQRACILKGVSGVKSLNDLQALVWGGRLESISMPVAGSECALVKFLTPEACQNYLGATKNGIGIPKSTEKVFVSVDRQSESNSTNDAIDKYIKQDASRCIRVIGADDDLSNRALLKVVCDEQKPMKTIDRITQGKTACGQHYIEFRFGDIYQALSFKRFLMDDEKWEHCLINYAPDPCELARGVHYEDSDEE